MGDILIKGELGWVYLQDASESYAALKSLKLCSNSLHQSTSHTFASLVMPQLRSLTMTGFCLAAVSESPPHVLPWFQLERLVLDNSNFIPRYVKLCTNLRILEINLDLDAGHTGTSTPVVHNGIHTLKLLLEGLEDSDEAAWLEAFERDINPLSLPGLNSLHIEANSDYPPTRWPAVPMFDLLEKSCCKIDLTVLSFIDVYISNVELISFLHNTPSVEGLTVCDHSFHDYIEPNASAFPVTPTFISRLHAFWEDHTYRRPLTSFLPNLRRLSLRSRMNFEEHTFVEMVTSRWISPDSMPHTKLDAGVVCLRRVEVHVGHEIFQGRVFGTKVDPRNSAH
ncbi:hypothetical protein BT96DRAFT_1000342 [Gymnopus androsaceus JB14]|uniref:F-box domain-containing protein n=1 Tax=Gymnopus androsaceus JB14 TaxID=1447944 RepID=A0A6A4H457_9AGAR|nr:hypothetical protein BT96DRAFT_1000342 [Gymnopus androsaceus JB14]